MTTKTKKTRRSTPTPPRPNTPAPPRRSPPIVTVVQIPIRDAITKALQLSIPTGYELIARGKLHTHLVGRRRYTTPQDLAACVELLRTEGATVEAATPATSSEGAAL